ncbi:50S ribosomal protein L25 [Cohnella nanjingensis]|uniref:Large ribosomal subunit protein bL25 n=1 Tax=Cohnella nanjingensis TaxID=1387779 RepID=A0A7X0RWF8_9BACL|nr:50S ribosomal protein L25 [Cohnella nanjingensis]MBB6674908.1 50S ribosomal protein L25 [Cohnella nanjingensis]
MNSTLHAESRQRSTKGALRELRSQGKIPGVVYGQGLSTASVIALDAKELSLLLKCNPHAVLDLEVQGSGSQSVLLTDIQRDALNGRVLHVDFRKIDLNQTIKTPVRLEFTGSSPGEKEGGMLQVVLHELEVECIAKNLPESIEVDISALGFGEHVTVADLNLPEGVTAVPEADAVVVAVLAPQKERSEDEVEAMDDAAEENVNHSNAAEAVEKD